MMASGALCPVKDNLHFNGVHVQCLSPVSKNSNASSTGEVHLYSRSGPDLVSRWPLARHISYSTF